MFCNNCGTELAKDSSFCTNCGNKIENSIPQATPPTPTTHATLPTSMQPPTPTSQSPHESNNTETNKKRLIIISIIVGSLLVVAISVLTIMFFMKSFKNRYGSNKGDDRSQTVNIDDDLDISNEDNDNPDDSLDTTIDDELEDYDVVNDDDIDTKDIDNSEITYEPTYNYSELPDVLSIDSDTRFTYYDYFTLSNSSVYSFQFNETNATEEDFIKACEDYKLLIQELNGFTYMQEVNDQHYAETGQLNYYLFRDDYELGITPSNEEGYYFAYISIQSYSMVAGGNEQIDELDMINYNYFIADRDYVSFTFDETINMDNGLSFYIYEVMGNHTEDGGVVIDVLMDISSYYPDYYFNNGDFLLLPLDSNGNILSDAIPVNIVHDESGNEVTMPFLLSASSYDTYTLYFPVPAETYSLLLYATNVLIDDYSYPIYVMRVGD